MSSIIEKLEAEILKEPDQYADPVYREYWRTSNFGRCYRLQYWYRKGVEITNPIELRALKIFRVGNLFHRDLQSLLPKDRVEVAFKEEDVYGHADYVGDDYVEDFKTIGDFQWKLLNKKDADVERDKLQYIYQLMTYCYFLKKPRGILTFIHKDSYTIKSFEFKFADYEKMVRDELLTLRLYWDKQDTPPARPRAYNLKDCAYCNFQGKCDALEGNTAKERESLCRPSRKALF